MKMVGHKTEAIHRWHAIAEETDAEARAIRRAALGKTIDTEGSIAKLREIARATSKCGAS
jgi:hypothetical protein